MDSVDILPAPKSSSRYADRWAFSSYEEYLRDQCDRGRQTRGLTTKYAAHRNRLIELVHEYCPEARTALCLGARHPIEVQSLIESGFDAEGIDLFADDCIRKCDMAQLDLEPAFRERQFDLFFSCFSLDHCFDIDRFCEHVLPKCRRVVAGAVSIRNIARASAWNCIVFDFQKRDATAGDFEKVFAGFEVACREIVGGVLRFVLLRKNSTTKSPGHSITVLKNAMVANHIPSSRYSRNSLETLLRAQIANSLELGWKPEDILLVTNFSFAFAGVEAAKIELDGHCPRGSKMFAVQHLLRERASDETVLWSHDLDCWQNVWFSAPQFADVGACEYSRPTFNGGSVFWRRAGLDIADEVVRRLRDDRASCEEPTMNAVFKHDRFRRRVTILNSTYNVGCSGFKERLFRSEKPVRASHFRPTNRLAWATHVLNRHSLEQRSASARLESLLRRWFPGLPSELAKSRRGKSDAGREL